MAVDIKIPSPGESISEVEIVEWLKPDGSWVEKDEALCEVESEKVTLTLHADESGQLKILIPAGTTANVGDVACSIDTKAERKEPEPDEVREPVKSEKPEQISEKQPQNEPEEAVPESKPEPVASSGPPEEREGPDAARGLYSDETRPVKRVKLSQLRKKVAERLVAVKNETAMLTTFNEIDMSAVKDVRARFREKFEEQHGVRLGIMSFFTRAVCESLVESPTIGSILDGDELITPEFADIGVAVSAPKGLVVPVVRDAHKMTFAQIERTIADLAERARRNKLTMDDLSGGNFTITNGGVFGSLLSTPILNPPQSAILGMHAIQERPIAINGEVTVRPMMYVALSYDHRVVDGKESVEFLKRVKELLEDPVRLLLGVSA